MEDSLLLDNQLCFPLYAAAKALIHSYEPYLKPLNLTYTQYIVMMVLWEEKEASVNRIGERVCLDSGTLSPLLNKLQKEGYISKAKGKDGRQRKVSLTEKGLALKEKAKNIPPSIASCLPLSKEEALALYELCYKTLKGLEHHE